MSYMHNLRFLTCIAMVLSLSSCSSVRLAVYDYQKRHADAMENSNLAAVNTPHKKENSTKRSLTEKASKYIGSNYRYGSCDPKSGFDCSGLVYYVAKSHEINLPRSSSSMGTCGKPIAWKEAEPGDLIFFGQGNKINHVGIVEKNKGNEMWIIHSSSSNGVLREDVLDSDYWKKRIMFAIDITTLKEKA